MRPAEPDYKLLYEQSQQRLYDVEARAVKQIVELEQQLQLALLEINELRAKLFGSKSDKRVKKAAGKQLDILPLGATSEEVATSDALLKEGVATVNQEGQKAAEKRAKAAISRMVLPAHLEREEVIIDPQGDLSNYHIIGEEVTEVLTPDWPGP